MEDELARPAAVDPECLDAAERRGEPLAEEDADEANLPALAGADTNDDLVEAFSPALLDVDVAAERGSDRGREVVAGKLLGSLIDGKVSVGDVDRLVRHLSIVTPIAWASYTYEYTHIGRQRNPGGRGHRVHSGAGQGGQRDEGDERGERDKR